MYVLEHNEKSLILCFPHLIIAYILLITLVSYCVQLDHISVD